MKEHIKIDASVASHKGNIHSKNEEKFYLNGQYMDLNQQKDSTSKSDTHCYKQSVYGIASGTVRGECGEQAAFITIEALSRYHLYLEENGPTSFAVKKQRLIEHLESAKGKIKELSEEEDMDDIGATMVGLIIDENRAFGFSIGEEGFYMVKEDAVRRVPMDNAKNYFHIGSDEPIEKILRVTDEFILDQGDRLLLTSKDTYWHAMEDHILNLAKTLSTKESTRAYIKELLTKEEQKNLTALMVYVEELEGYVTNKQGRVIFPGMVSAEDEENHHRIENEDVTDTDYVSRTADDPETDNAINRADTSRENQRSASGQQRPVEGIDRKDDSERDRIFEQRYAESRILFNKKLQRKDMELSAGDKFSGDGNSPFDRESLGEEEGYEGDSGRDADISETRFEEFDEEYHEDPSEDEESPWRTRSKFLLIALLAVGVIIMAFAFGTIRNLEDRIFNSSAENVNGGESEEEPGEAITDEESADGEEPGEGLSDENEDSDSDENPIIEDENANENANENEEPVEEEPVDEPVEEEVSEPVAVEETYDTYEIQSGDTIYSISQAFYGDGSMVDEIISLNNIEDINNIQVGDVLRLPSQN